jgi:L-fucose mutarotase/ribose pyranase (RbsD/FucU family)
MKKSNEIVVADGTLPPSSMAQRLVGLDGHATPELLEAILKLLSLQANRLCMEGVL